MRLICTQDNRVRFLIGAQKYIARWCKWSARWPHKPEIGVQVPASQPNWSIAQLVERHPDTVKVTGSIPVIPT
jgi:hypothetical protein